MKKTNFLTVPAVALMLLGTGSGLAGAKTTTSHAMPNVTASSVGGYGGQTTGGVQNADHPTIVKNIVQLRNALKQGQGQYIVLDGQFDGNIDAKTGQKMTEADYAKGTGYDFNEYLKNPTGSQAKALSTASNKQKHNVEIQVPDNTTILGAKGNQLKNINFIVNGKNVILRNLNMQAPTDDFPAWDAHDGKLGNWNSNYDAITVKGGQNVWLDHNTLGDGDNPDHEPTSKTFNRQYQQHDGLSDISNQANNVTVSNSKYDTHDKAMLIGSSDKKTSDEGKLNTTIDHNTFNNTVQRTPRVRFGHVDIENNYYHNNFNQPYAFSYAFGYGKDAHITANHNYLDGAKPKQMAKHLIGDKQGASLNTKNTYVNGQDLNVMANGSDIKTSANTDSDTDVSQAIQQASQSSQSNGATLDINANDDTPDTPTPKPNPDNQDNHNSNHNDNNDSGNKQKPKKQKKQKKSKKSKKSEKGNQGEKDNQKSKAQKQLDKAKRNLLKKIKKMFG